MKRTDSFFGTDMAAERRSIRGQTVAGIEFEKQTVRGLWVERLTVTSGKGAAAIGRPIGHYHTVNTPEMDGIEEGGIRQAAGALGDVLRELTAGEFGEIPPRVLVAGLGNERLSADCVGPLTCRNVTATRHLAGECPELFSTLGCAEVCAVTPGVSAESGMDAADVVGAVAEKIRPDLVIAVDAYAARSTARLGTTLQVSDTGIIPGGGVGNHRLPIDKSVLGVPVFVIGVPTVTDSRIFFEEEAAKRGLKSYPAAPDEEPYFVCPKAVDRISETAAKIIASAINEVYGIS
ncbi:MAG: GPR endopeptidase [Clostridia bacterium]|nr:GPR endopeptidase [Clostridia bacterium]